MLIALALVPPQTLSEVVNRIIFMIGVELDGLLAPEEGACLGFARDGFLFSAA